MHDVHDLTPVCGLLSNRVNRCNLGSNSGATQLIVASLLQNLAQTAPIAGMSCQGTWHKQDQRLGCRLSLTSAKFECN